jgi:7,8-dihydropterin-6-yl-methyl-4-(beta-D-ribofuranosyl)aminobenzene 5'-phosphate synthase
LIQPRHTPVQIADGVWVTREILRQNDFEDVGGAFFLDEACTMPDPIIDDQTIYIETANGIVVLLGCALAGTSRRSRASRISPKQAQCTP